MDDFYTTAEQAVATAAHVELSYDEQGILSGMNVDWNKAIADEEMYYHNIKLQQP